MNIINPYSNIDFANAVRVNAITHEHIFNQTRLKTAYDRGIRWFACVNYTPAVSAAPSLAAWSGTYELWNFFDISAAYPNGGIDGGDTYTAASARAKVPNYISIRATGLVISYKDSTNNVVYEQFVGNTWSVENNDWESFQSSELNSRLTKRIVTYSQTIEDFIAEDGTTVDVDSLPALGNAEHAILGSLDGTIYASHFNVLGNMFAEPCVVQPIGYTRTFIDTHPYFNIENIEQVYTQDLQIEGKVFGTLNHTYSTSLMKKYIQYGGSMFKAMETFNQGFTSIDNQKFRDAYDILLKEGYKLWNVAVCDWQGSREFINRPIDYVQECSFDRGCNVLYMPSNYESLTKSEKVEAGLDSYIAGTFYASGLGNYRIIDLSESNGYIHFSVDGSPSTLKIITAKGVKTYNNISEVSHKVRSDDKYVRFEVYYYSDTTDMDFIFTQPVWIEGDDNTAQRLLLL